MPGKLQQIADVDPTWAWETDEGGCISHLSPEAEDHLGRPAAALLGRTLRACAANAPAEILWSTYEASFARREPIAHLVFPHARDDGEIRWFRLSGQARFSGDGAFLGYRGLAVDTGFEARLHGALRDALAKLNASHAVILDQNRRFDAALSNMTQGLCMFDAQARLVVVNPRYCEIFGVVPEQMRVGMSQREICEVLVERGCYRRETTVDSLCESTRRALLDPNPAPAHRELADGRILSISYRPIEGGGWVSTFEDITERRRNEARIAHMARHDGLTDLPNRSALRESGLEMLSRAGAHRDLPDPGRVAMLCIDLDRFKAVNDTYGHGAGDELLRAVADRLRASLRGDDLVARLGGDEFAILMGATDAAGAQATADRLIEVVTRPYLIGDARVEIGMSVGIALAEQDADDIERLLKNADTALYHAKGAGRGAACLFEPAMDESFLARRALESDLAEALRTEAFEVHYQPLIDLDGDRVTGLEALIRWTHPVRGPVSPGTFIPVAEETGLIVGIGEWVLRRACRDAAAWPADVRVAVNVSAVQLRHRDFARVVLMALASTGLPPTRLELEITEGVLLDDTEATLETLHLLRRAGIRVCMDDFGTGYSSLSYLRRFPFDKIKIDRSFIQDAGRTTEAAAIIRAIVSLGESLGITTLAEGVETAEQLAAVRAEGCQAIQGFLFSRPRPAAEIATLLTSGRVRAAA